MSLGRRVLRAAAHRVKRGLDGLHHAAATRLADHEAAARRELQEHLKRPAAAPPPPRTAPHPYAQEYRLIGAVEGANLQEVQRCWRQRVRELHPDRYAAESPEQRRASDRLRRVNSAYGRLRRYLESE